MTRIYFDRYCKKRLFEPQEDTKLRIKKCVICNKLVKSFGVWEWHDNNRIWCGNFPMMAQPQRVSLLWFCLLARRRLSGAEITDLLWPDPDNSPDFCDNVIKTHMCELRKTMKDIDYTLVCTWGQGYELVKKSDNRKYGC